MSNTKTDFNLITEDFWQRFLRRAVAPVYKPDVKRETPRYAYQGEAKLFMEENGEWHTRWLSLLNISLDGVTAKGNTELPMGVKVFLEMNPEGTPFVVRGEIVHCTTTVGGYKIGIKLEFDR